MQQALMQERSLVMFAMILSSQVGLKRLHMTGSKAALSIRRIGGAFHRRDQYAQDRITAESPDSPSRKGICNYRTVRTFKRCHGQDRPGTLRFHNDSGRKTRCYKRYASSSSLAYQRLWI